MNSQQGFGAISAIIILVIMASLAAAIVTVGTTQQTTFSMDVIAGRVEQAARAGSEWGLYAVTGSSSTWDGGVACAASATPGTAGTTRTKTGITFNNASVSVTCQAVMFHEGESAPSTPVAKTFYTITSTAVFGTNAADLTYVKRTRVVTVEN